MSDNEEIIAILMACSVIALIIMLLFLLARKEKKKIIRILHSFPKEVTEKLQKSVFLDYKENFNFLVGTSLIYNINFESIRVKIYIVFYNSNDNMFKSDSFYLSRKDFEKKELQIGQFITTLHNKSLSSYLNVSGMI